MHKAHRNRAVPVTPALDDLEMLLLIRHFEEALLRLFAAGKLSGTTHTCIGQEVIPVAIMPLLRDSDFVFSTHRGHGHYLARFRDPEGLLAEIMGREGGVCLGVGGSQHINRGRYFSTGVQGESMPVAVGAALQLKREGGGDLALAFIGDGTWGQGAVYEALNMAALWQVPLLVVVENNEIAQTTARSDNMASAIEARVTAFGINYVLGTDECAATLRNQVAPLIERVRRNQEPLVIEVRTRRLAAHSKGDDTRDPAVIKSLAESGWHARCQKDFPDMFAEVDKRAKERVAELVDRLSQRPASVWSRPKHSNEVLPGAVAKESTSKTKGRVLDNLNRALHQAMAADERVMLIGEDLLDPYGGAFKVARGLSSAFPDRVITTPLSELGFTGVANGLALAGQRPIVEFMFGDFIFLAFDQIVNVAAKTVNMYGRTRPHHLLIRCPVGGHRGYGATHSQTVVKHFIGIPDLDLFELSPLHDHTSLVPWLLGRGKPSILFESKILYARERISGREVDDLYSIRFHGHGLTAEVFIGDTPQLLIITGGGLFDACLKAGHRLFFEHEIEATILVPFQLYPFRAAELANLLRMDTTVFVVEESTSGGTWGAEVAAVIASEFPARRSPVRLVHSADSIIPSARHLEQEVLVSPESIVQSILANGYAPSRRSDN